jgi:transcriptional regulator with XRE-family HTH domain
MAGNPGDSPKPRAKVPVPVSRYIKSRLGKRLRALRGEARLEDVADAAGMSAGYLSRIENGHNAPSIVTLLALQKALKAPSIEDLIGEVNSPLLPSRALWEEARGHEET